MIAKFCGCSSIPLNETTRKSSRRSPHVVAWSHQTVTVRQAVFNFSDSVWGYIYRFSCAKQIDLISFGESFPATADILYGAVFKNDENRQPAHR
jgi:hypothetical protein